MIFKVYSSPRYSVILWFYALFFIILASFSKECYNLILNCVKKGYLLFVLNIQLIFHKMSPQPWGHQIECNCCLCTFSKSFIVLETFIIVYSHPFIFLTGELKSVLPFCIIDHLAALLYLISSFLIPALRPQRKNGTFIQGVGALSTYAVA